MLFEGDIMGGLKTIFQGVFDFLLAIPKAIFNTVTDMAYKNFVNISCLIKLNKKNYI